MKLCARKLSRATKTSATARSSPALASARASSATMKASIAFGRAAKRDGAALGEAAGSDGKRASRALFAPSPALRARRRAQAREQRRVELGRRLASPMIHASTSGSGASSQTLELVEFGLAHRRKIGVGELAHHQVHLAHAPPPGAKQNPSPPRIERGAAQHRAGHEGPFSNRNAGAVAWVPIGARLIAAQAGRRQLCCAMGKCGAASARLRKPRPHRVQSPIARRRHQALLSRLAGERARAGSRVHVQ